MLKEIENNVILTGLKFPESPVFDKDGNLWFVEIKGGNLSKWDGNILHRYPVDGTPNGAAIDKNGMIWFCDSKKGEIRTFDSEKNVIESKCSYTNDGNRLIRPNDLIFDSAGNILFSDHADGRDEPRSTFCVLPKGGSVAKVIASNKLFANGLALMNNGKTLVYAETYNQKLWIAEWDNSRLELNNERVFANVGNGPWGPDGMAFDKSENLYVAVFNEYSINVYSKAGDLIDKLKCEGSRPTSCAFDPSGKLGLVVTEAEHGKLITYPSQGKGLKVYYG
ncbi:SMP-30/gluconolactonase/LRE family protein [Aurantibacter sp.]|uniref:SMP-30/gluconolactonase/LRE family protein n=1 Tax=Aurantibacter sp. TaxID=2807103 RepID=UPI0032666849